MPSSAGTSLRNVISRRGIARTGPASTSSTVEAFPDSGSRISKLGNWKAGGAAILNPGQAGPGYFLSTGLVSLEYRARPR
jgi:hypothetical protein